MPIDPRMVAWDKPAIDPRMVAWDQPDNSAQIEAQRKDPGFAGNLAQGTIKGAADIGATLLTPFDAVTGALGLHKYGIGRDDRRAAINAIDAEVSNPDSFAHGAGKLTSYVAGTAGVPGAIAKGVAMIPGATAALPTLLPALQSGGMSLGATGKSLPLVQQLLARGTMGAVAGGATSGLIDPSTTGQGMAFGAAIPIGAQAAGAIGSGLKNAAGWTLRNTIGGLTGTSGETMRSAYESGKSGATDYLENATGKVPMTDVVDRLKEGLQSMKIARGNAYRNGMVNISNDATVLDMAPINKAVQNISSMGSYKGQVLNKNAAGTVQELADQVAQWKSLNPAEFHTPEGLDALKQSIGDIRDATQFGTPARRAADTVYNAVKAEINKQAPTYAKVMGDYSEASNTIKELERSLSAGEKSTADTSLRKLQSIMRNNANTNYGNRLSLLETLKAQGGQDLMPALAGQATNSWLPRGMVGSIEKAGMPLAGAINPSTLLMAPFMSPRLMGLGAYGLGSLSRNASNALPAGIPMLNAPISMMNTLPITANYLRSTSNP